MMQRALVIVFAPACCAAVLGCVGPPSHFSVRSAAATEAPPASIARIGQALREEPPPPGADMEGWAGLATNGGMPAPMHHHGMHMEGMDMPDAGPSATPAPAPTDAMPPMPAMPGMQGMKHAH